MQRLVRQAVLGVADRPVVERLFQTSPITDRLVRRFVAGESLPEAIVAARAIAGQGMTTTLDLLGEHVASEAAAAAAVGSYVDILERMYHEGLEPNISVKLSMLGLDLDRDVAEANVTPILQAARRVGGFVRIDMEGSDATEPTIAIAEALHDRFPHEVGTVVQSYLYRSEQDVERLVSRGMRLRLVKGAYAEPATVAYQDAAAVDAAYGRLMERLLDGGAYPAIATHDPALIRSAKGYALRIGRAADTWEFQMLYGVRRDAQRALVAEGYRMRVYVPFGRDWYPYFTRRIAERPANALFVVRQLFEG